VALSSGQTGEKKGLVDTVSPFKSYGHVYGDDSFESMRPRIMGTHGVVSTGHYLATLAGIEVLRKGGNAFDAGVAAAMALKVTKMGYAGWTGVAPLILYSARDDEVMTRVGAGTTPARATLAYFQEHGKTDINMALIPADVDVWLAALDRYGTISFQDAAQAALEVAEGGYHLYKHQKYLLDELEQEIQRFPYNVEFWFQHGVGGQRLGDLMVNKDLGRLIRYMMAAERKSLASGGSRSEGIGAARDAFYEGEPARAAADFYRRFDDGLVAYEDLAGYEGKWMAPLSTTFRGYDVYVCDGWSQGPRFILFLNMLGSFDLEALGYNTPEYIHVVSQVINLGMSDSHKYVGDPDFVKAPKALYAKEYAGKRVELIDPENAFEDMPPWGDPDNMRSVASDSPRIFRRKESRDGSAGRLIEDTTSLNVMDAEGNVFSMTESDGHMVSPLIPGWGFGLGRRMEQLNLDANLANVMAPKKRPRNTNTPVLIMKDGKPFMGLSTPGGEQQLQAILQVFLNVVVWGMSPEQALDQPRFGSYNFPATGFEVNENPGRLCLEERIPSETFETLRKMGHKVESWGLWNWRACALTVTYRDPETGLLIAAGDVRRETHALGY
jgi:gamma-glutamyltranspeptidase/glutathione hydrolase